MMYGDYWGGNNTGTPSSTIHKQINAALNFDLQHVQAHATLSSAPANDPGSKQFRAVKTHQKF